MLRRRRTWYSTLVLDRPIPAYPEYPLVEGMHVADWHPSLWWVDQVNYLGEREGPKWIVSILLVPVCHGPVRHGRTIPQPTVSDYGWLGDDIVRGADPWDVIPVGEDPRSKRTIYARSIDLMDRTAPAIVVDVANMTATTHGSNQLLVAGTSHGIRLVPSSNLRDGHRRDIRCATLINIQAGPADAVPTRLDCRDLTAKLIRKSREVGVVRPGDLSSPGWLDECEVIMALCSGTDQVPAKEGTGCYLSLRSREVYSDPLVELGPVSVGQLRSAGILAPTPRGKLLTHPGRLLLAIEGGHVRPFIGGRDAVLMEHGTQETLVVKGRTKRDYGVVKGSPPWPGDRWTGMCTIYVVAISNIWSRTPGY